MPYAHHMFEPRPHEMAIDKDQILNSTGAYVFKLDKWKVLDRFLILGCEGGTYYANERKLTRENARGIIELIKEDGVRVVNTICDISYQGRGLKNDPCIFALALACTYGDEKTKKSAYSSITHVCRTGTHLFSFCDAVKSMRGGSSGLKKGIAKFYEQDVDKVAYQVVKYRQRNGWAHHDVLNLYRPRRYKGKTNPHAQLYQYIVGKPHEERELPAIVHAFEQAKKLDVSKVEEKGLLIDFIQNNGLTWEMLPTEALNDPDIWIALLPRMPLMATVRNLGKMTAIGAIKTFSEEEKYVVDKLKNRDEIKKSKIHPFSLYLAWKTYESGHGVKGSLKWSTNTSILAALEDAFYLSFTNVEPMGARTLIGLDVSGSMASAHINNTTVTAREASAALSMISMKTEPQCKVMGFTCGFVDLKLTKNSDLKSVMETIEGLDFDSTDCSLPVLYALKNKIPVDLFLVYTDNETNTGRIQPFAALKKYRKETGINAKMVVCGMTATGFTIADPSDAGMLDVVGADGNLYQAIREFYVG